MIPGDECGLNFLRFVLELRKTQEIATNKKLTRPGIEPEPAG